MTLAQAIYTIGHSTRPIEAFIEMLRAAGVTRLIDVRAVPRSRFNPQYNRDALEKSLNEAGIDYRSLPSLGGLRQARADSPNVGLKEGFRGFADYALTAEFRAALGVLTTLAGEQPSAFMCAEADWRQCHRQLIADRLVSEGRDVRHIVKDGIEAATLNPLAERRTNGLVYAKAPVKAKTRPEKKKRDDPKSPRFPGF
ncbi:MAG TPA: DUF488 domain-containing protein [Alphaproteobacteria bacterium]|nr:DUF488 domain-containing protein [Alphaproteobacteria bacterium]